MEISQEMMDKYGLYSLEHFRANADELETDVMYYELVLRKTDYITHKIFERFIEELASASLVTLASVVLQLIFDVKTEYKEILQFRKFARQEIDRLEAENVNDSQ